MCVVLDELDDRRGGQLRPVLLLADAQDAEVGQVLALRPGVRQLIT